MFLRSFLVCFKGKLLTFSAVWHRNIFLSILLHFSLFLYFWEFGLIFLFAKGGFKFTRVKKRLNSSSPLHFCSALPVRMHWPLDSFFHLTIIFSQNSRDIAPLLEARMTFGSLELPDLLLLLSFSLVVMSPFFVAEIWKHHYSKPWCRALWSHFHLVFDEPFQSEDPTLSITQHFFFLFSTSSPFALWILTHTWDLSELSSLSPFFPPIFTSSSFSYLWLSLSGAGEFHLLNPPDFLQH